MMVSKFVRIEFADSRISAANAIQDIRKAVQFVSLNLYSRHDVQLQMPMISIDNMVVLEMKIPDEKADSFPIGNHLRGISVYLLKKCDNRYDQYPVGNRLLTYTEISNPSFVGDYKNTFTAVDQLEAIASFAHLLQRSDPDSVNRIYRILAILKEDNNKQ